MKVNIQSAIESIFNSYLSTYSYIVMPFQSVKSLFLENKFLFNNCVVSTRLVPSSL